MGRADGANVSSSTLVLSNALLCGLTSSQAFTIAALTRSAPLVSRGQKGASIRAAVSNPGDLPVALAAGPRWNGSASGYTVTSAATNATELSGGATNELTFMVDTSAVTPLGATTLTVELAAREQLLGAPV